MTLKVPAKCLLFFIFYFNLLFYSYSLLLFLMFLFVLISHRFFHHIFHIEINFNPVLLNSRMSATDGFLMPFQSYFPSKKKILQSQTIVHLMENYIYFTRIKHMLSLCRTLEKHYAKIIIMNARH